MGFRVWGQGAYGQAGNAVECGFAEDWIRGRTGLRRCGRRRARLQLCLWLKLQLIAGEFDHATLYVGRSRYGWTGYPGERVRFHVCLLGRFRVGIENHWSVGVVVEGWLTQAYVSLPSPGAAFYRGRSGVPI